MPVNLDEETGLVPRVYSFPAWRIRLGQVGLLFMVGLGVLTMVVGEGPTWVYPVFAVFWMGVAWWVLVIFPRRKVTENRDGIGTFDLAFVVPKVVPWEEIERFKPMAGTFGYMVVAIGKSGSYTPIVGLDAKATTRWVDGETDDIVAELNHRLALWQAELGLLPT